VIVNLTWSEITIAAWAAVMRQIANLRDGRVDAHGAEDGDGWGKHVEGAIGEYAASKALGVFWSGAHGILRAPDIGGRYEVRTRFARSGSLIVRTTDRNDDAIVVFVLGELPTFNVVGWLRVGDGKRSEYWTDKGNGRPPAWFVPCSALRPLEELELPDHYST